MARQMPCFWTCQAPGRYVPSLQPALTAYTPAPEIMCNHLPFLAYLTKWHTRSYLA